MPRQYVFYQPRSQGLFVVKNVVESGPGKGWLSHDQNLQYIWKIYYRN